MSACNNYSVLKQNSLTNYMTHRLKSFKRNARITRIYITYIFSRYCFCQYWMTLIILLILLFHNVSRISAVIWKNKMCIKKCISTLKKCLVFQSWVQLSQRCSNNLFILVLWEFLWKLWYNFVLSIPRITVNICLLMQYAFLCHVENISLDC